MEVQAAKKTASKSITAKKKSKKKKRRSRRRRSRRRRSYNKERTRKQAIEFIRTQSTDLCYIAGLNPITKDSIVTDSLRSLFAMLNEGEIDSLSCILPEGELGEDPEELELEDDIVVDVDESFKMLWLAFVSDGEDKEYTAGGIRKDELMESIMGWLGVPYRFGGTTRKRIDCSAFTQKVFLETCEIKIPRTARTQVKIGQPVKKKHLQFGDLVFFKTYSRRFASHVGIYLCDDLFAHASSRHGVTVSSLNSTYYKKRYYRSRRLGVQDLMRFSIHKAERKMAVQKH